MGSEMCIRDSLHAGHAVHAVAERTRQRMAAGLQLRNRPVRLQVSGRCLCRILRPRPSGPRAAPVQGQALHPARLHHPVRYPDQGREPVPAQAGMDAPRTHSPVCRRQAADRSRTAGVRKQAAEMVRLHRVRGAGRPPRCVPTRGVRSRGRGPQCGTGHGQHGRSPCPPRPFR